jgi:transcriptional regulator with XRE-family HTH domain
MIRDHTVDIHVGAQMRQRSVLLGMSQSKVGDAVGLTFQQIQKYERGANRIGSSRLYEFAKVLDVPVSYFWNWCGLTTRSARPGCPSASSKWSRAQGRQGTSRSGPAANGASAGAQPAYPLSIAPKCGPAGW